MMQFSDLATRWSPANAASLRPWVVTVTLVTGFALLLSGCTTAVSDEPITWAPGAPLSEDPDLHEALDRSLQPFLAALRRGEWNETYSVGEDERDRYRFFYRSLERGARDARPVVLKAYPVENDAHLITVMFMAGGPDALSASRIVELWAVPVTGGVYRFRCPYERNIAGFQSRQIGDVTYRFSGPFDAARAAEFVQFKTKLSGLQGCVSRPLQYDCFQSLDQLLRTYGLIYDSSKCNFLHHDLGFLWHDGERFATGTGDERYIFGYVRGALPAGAKRPDAIYSAYVNGVATYFGGYGLSGDSMATLAQQFREELARRPDIDFLEEFDKGRKSSVQRHFSYYVMCALLCQEIASRHGDAAALGPVESGADGERFFERLDSLLGVTRENFHDTIVGLIGARG